jgi:hypothetical protein
MKYFNRLENEKKVLRQVFPSFRIQDPDGANGGVIGSLHSNMGNKYLIWMALGEFPNKAPKVYIIDPHPLLTLNGEPLSEINEGKGSVRMHVLPPDAHGHPQICHYNDQFWHPDVMLTKILFKVRLWIHAYEEHLQTGEYIDTYLSHME